MGIGAALAAMNTMYAIVARRTREVSALRALGFSRSAVLIAFMLEGLILAMAGAVPALIAHERAERECMGKPEDL